MSFEWCVPVCDVVMFPNSRGSSGRERNDKPASSAPSRPGSLSLGGSGGSKEASDELSQEDPRREASDSPKLQGGDKAKSDRSRSRDSGEGFSC